MAKLWGFLAVFFMVLAVAFAVLGAWTLSHYPPEEWIVAGIPFVIWIVLFGLLAWLARRTRNKRARR
jgi:uncharacterized membrane protein YfcA